MLLAGKKVLTTSCGLMLLFWKIRVPAFVEPHDIDPTSTFL